MKQKYLHPSDINKVAPSFKQTVLDAWAKGEDVPYGVIYLSDRKPSKAEIEYGRSLEKVAEEVLRKHS